ncbi:hypothetical protein [Acidithiobacillus acidisediminis]|uniref:hypothetical protein n=1 Tax=Acidithiobacillus acidisediminis TaxID=2937799 RepID=UPI00201041AF|nr:hypothetical protein [Acidithiobacillus sp. S30A2]
MNWQEIQKKLLESGWLPMESAPKNVPILGFCIHESDPDVDGAGEGKISTYAAHAESLSHVPDGPHVLVWGGEYEEVDWDSGAGFIIPAWWFRFGSDFEEPAAPIAWRPVFDPSNICILPHGVAR